MRQLPHAKRRIINIDETTYVSSMVDVCLKIIDEEPRTWEIIK